jgi:hypothetical protein
MVDAKCPTNHELPVFYIDVLVVLFFLKCKVIELLDQIYKKSY